MGIFKKREKRAIDVSALDPTLQALICGDVRISAEEAVQVPMVAACVEWITGTVARLPVQLFKKDGETVTELEDDPRVRLLNRETGDLLDAYQLKKAWCRDYLLRGNGYLYIHKDGNTPRGIYYVDARQVSVERNADPVFKTAAFLVGGQRYRDFDFVRITRNTLDGVTGIGVVEESPLILQVAYETLKYQRQLVKAGGCRKGFLLSEKTVTDQVMEKLREAWKKLFKSGEENVIVLNNGIKFQEASNTSVEMQMNENKKSDGESVCNLFGLSPVLFSGSVTDEQYNNAIKTAVLPILDAMTEAYNKAMLMESEKDSLYFEIDTRTLLKGDIEKRFSAYKLAAEANIMQLDEIRKRENLPALGMNFVKLGLQDVLYNPKTGEIFTPNTGVKTNIRDGRLQNVEDRDILEQRENPYRGADGRYTFGPGGGGKKRKTKYAPSPQRNQGGIQLSPKKYAKLTGTLNTRFPGLETGEIRVVRDANYEYRVEADGFGGFITLSKRKI